MFLREDNDDDIRHWMQKRLLSNIIINYTNGLPFGHPGLLCTIHTINSAREEIPPRQPRHRHELYKAAYLPLQILQADYIMQAYQEASV